ncbi:hypothetical protein L6452_06001 [Arctium lappa]|uniref:Uncharacterized protein n=1 Tax=Arctium lappa TaxID=4217 RepID=A0ACB9EHD0_ARCLA|nr:hypothetical protein L6452_06001 [Arctium lappa]
MWQWKWVFRTGLVEVSEVNAYTPLPIFLLHDHNISQPVGIFHFSDFPGLEKIIGLVIDYFVSFWRELTSLLFDRFERRIDVESMRNDLGVDGNNDDFFYSIVVDSFRVCLALAVDDVELRLLVDSFRIHWKSNFPDSVIHGTIESHKNHRTSYDLCFIDSHSFDCAKENDVRRTSSIDQDSLDRAISNLELNNLPIMMLLPWIVGILLIKRDGHGHQLQLVLRS